MICEGFWGQVGVAKGVGKRGKNGLGENRELTVKKFDTDGLSLHVFSIP